MSEQPAAPKLAPGEITAYVFAAAVPLAIGGIVAWLILRPTAAAAAAVAPPPLAACKTNQDCGAGTCGPDGACVCPPGFSGSGCSYTVSAAAHLGTQRSCTDAPRACTNDSQCADCGSPGLQFACTELTESQTTTGVAGKFCAPRKPASGCRSVPPNVPSADQIPGDFVWEGWRDANTAAWSCACPFAQYPADDAADGGCRRAASLCTHGVWTYPLPGHKVGDAPTTAGACACDAVPCSSSQDCAGTCGPAGVCVDQRLGLDPTTGLPQCVRDTCAPGGQWKAATGGGGAYGSCACKPGFESTGFACVKRSTVALRQAGSAPQVLRQARAAAAAETKRLAGKPKKIESTV